MHSSMFRPSRAPMLQPKPNISIFSRPSKLLTAILIAAVICLGWQYADVTRHFSWLVPAAPETAAVVEDEQNLSEGHGALHWNAGETSNLDTLKADAPGGILVENAHRLPTADSFLPHFKAITQLPGMTMSEAKAGCKWLFENVVNFQYAEDSDWVQEERTDSELESRRKEWHEFILTKLMPFEPYKDRFKGRGLVLVAGHEKSIKRVRVLLRALAKLKSNIAVELHYWDDEMTEESKASLLTMWPKLYFNDLSAPSNIFKTTKNSEFINYQLKTAAMVNSRFAEPLLIDSDNIPVIDPELLYESDVYREYGTLFWPDIARTRPQNPMWAITNTACRMNEFEQESGQMIVDKRKFFYHLQLAAWFNGEHPEYYNEFLLGDKDMFRFTWHALKTKYGFPSKWITSVGTVTDGYYCGHSFAQHHPDGNIAFLHGGLVKTITKEAMKWFKDTQGGIFQVYKRSAFDERHDVNVNVGIKWTEAEWLPDRPANLPMQSCTDMYDEKPRPFDELVPGFEQTFRELGGYWLIDE